MFHIKTTTIEVDSNIFNRENNSRWKKKFQDLKITLDNVSKAPSYPFQCGPQWRKINVTQYTILSVSLSAHVLIELNFKPPITFDQQIQLLWIKDILP